MFITIIEKQLAVDVVKLGLHKNIDRSSMKLIMLLNIFSTFSLSQLVMSQ